MSGQISIYIPDDGGAGAASSGTLVSYVVATPEYLSEIDAKAEKLRQEILVGEAVFAVTGTTYYVSNSGDDLNDGKSAEKAWATLERVNNAQLEQGDAVLFERGGTWRGNMNARAGVTYSAYGKGAKPCLIGSLMNYSVSGDWKETGTENVYKYDKPVADDAGLIVFNGGEAYTYKKVIGIDAFTGSPDELQNDLEMYHDLGEKRIYLYSSEGNPAERYSSIEFCLKQHIIKVLGDNVNIGNLCLKYGGAHGISSGARTGLTVRYCEMAWIGGSLQKPQEAGSTTRYGNAVEIYGACRDYMVDHCYIYQIYDAGVTHQLKSATSSSAKIMENVTYSSNLFEYCIYSIEYFLDQPNSPDDIMKNILFKDNICRFAGYGFGWQRPNKVARHIQGGWLNTNRKYPAENFVVEGNIFDRSRDVLISVAAQEKQHLPLMRDNVYIQDAGGLFGYYGTDYQKYFNYDENAVQLIHSYIKDEGAEVAYVFPESTAAARLPYSYAVRNMPPATKEDTIDTSYIPLLLYTAKDKTVLPFRLILPERYEADRKYPLILFLHSQNERGKDNIRQLASPFLERLYNDTDPSHDCIIIAPQCPAGETWADMPATASGEILKGTISDNNKYLDAAAALVRDIAKTYNADEKRIYAAGYSMGGNGVWAVSADNPDLFAAIVPVAGAGDITKAGIYHGISIWAFHGMMEYSVDIKYTENMVAALNEAGVEVRYTEYSNLREDCWENAELAEWLFAHSRK
ncbi:MAG: prolyl oligopeptidase family serine peptidase [Eubacteriales bacterium]|nr:prolyl oligopeptidase family serine peptidase [Eubacteriales bacterium]